MILIVDTFNYVDILVPETMQIHSKKITGMKPANPECVILCPKCAKIHLQASGGQTISPRAKLRTPTRLREGARRGRGGQGGEERRETLAHQIILT